MRLVTLTLVAGLGVAAFVGCSEGADPADAGGEVDAGACEADCETLTLGDLATADEQTAEAITLDPTCETGDHSSDLLDLVTDDEGRPVSWTERRIYQNTGHQITTDFEVETRCADGRIESFRAEMHAGNPYFRSSCAGLYCFDL